MFQSRLEPACISVKLYYCLSAIAFTILAYNPEQLYKLRIIYKLALSILHTLLVLVFIYCRHKSIIGNLVTIYVHTTACSSGRAV